jgi:hypothetical protein
MNPSLLSTTACVVAAVPALLTETLIPVTAPSRDSREALMVGPSAAT